MFREFGFFTVLIFHHPMAGKKVASSAFERIGYVLCSPIFQICVGNVMLVRGGGDGGDDNQDDGERMLTMVMTITKV